MTVEVNDTVERYTISGVGPYAFSYRIFAETDLAVEVLSTDSPPVPTALTYTTHYTVSGANDADGGSVTLTGDAATAYAGYTIDIRSNTPEEQPTSIRNQGRFLPEIHEDAFDHLSRQIQDLRRIVNASIRYPDSEVLSGVVESASGRKGFFLFWDEVTGALTKAAISAVTMTQQTIGALLWPATSAEIADAIVPEDRHFLRGFSARYGDDDESAFGGNFTAMHGMKPWGGSPAAYGGFVVNAPYGRFNIGTNWTSATGVHRQMYTTGYATLIQGDANGDIGLYTYGTSVAAGSDWQPKYSMIIRANGQQWVNSNGANIAWQQLISTGANTNDQGYGTDRATWGCPGLDGDIAVGALAGDMCWVLSDPTKSFRFGSGGGVRINGGSVITMGVNPGTSSYLACQVDTVTKSFFGCNVTADQLGTGTAAGDTIIRANASQSIWLLVNAGATKAVGVTSAGAVSLPSIGTTASAANVFVDNADSNNVLRVTSSIRYKTDVRDLPEAKRDVLSQLRPVLYKSLGKFDDQSRDWYGLIAEEVAEVVPELVTRGEGGQVEAVEYSRLVVPLIAKIQELEARLAALEP